MVSTSKGSRGRPKKKNFPSKAKMSMEVVSEAAPAVNDNEATPSAVDAGLEAIFSLIITLFQNASNLWLSPTEIAAAIREVGVTKKLTGFHVRLAIGKFSRKGILASHRLKLPGESEDREMYYRLASVTDAETPFTQRISESGDRRIVVTKVLFTQALSKTSKRLNLAQTDSWESSLFGVVAEKSLKQSILKRSERN